MSSPLPWSTVGVYWSVTPPWNTVRSVLDSPPSPEYSVAQWAQILPQRGEGGTVHKNLTSTGDVGTVGKNLTSTGGCWHGGHESYLCGGCWHGGHESYLYGGMLARWAWILPLWGMLARWIGWRFHWSCSAWSSAPRSASPTEITKPHLISYPTTVAKWTSAENLWLDISLCLSDWWKWFRNSQWQQ